MNKFEFLSFDHTPSEKHIGVLSVRVLGSVVIILRYKIVPKKDGSGFFPTCAGYKMPNRGTGDEYDECFMLDSRSDNDLMIKFVMHHFHNWQKGQQPSAFAQGASVHAQPSQSLGNSVPFAQQPQYAQQVFDHLPTENVPF